MLLAHLYGFGYWLMVAILSYHLRLPFTLNIIKECQSSHVEQGRARREGKSTEES